MTSEPKDFNQFTGLEGLKKHLETETSLPSYSDLSNINSLYECPTAYTVVITKACPISTDHLDNKFDNEADSQPTSMKTRIMVGQNEIMRLNFVAMKIRPDRNWWMVIMAGKFSESELREAIPDSEFCIHSSYNNLDRSKTKHPLMLMNWLLLCEQAMHIGMDATRYFELFLPFALSFLPKLQLPSIAEQVLNSVQSTEFFLDQLRPRIIMTLATTKHDFHAARSMAYEYDIRVKERRSYVIPHWINILDGNNFLMIARPYNRSGDLPPIGYAGMTVLPSSVHDRYITNLVSFGVVPEWRNCGIGKEIIDKCLTVCRHQLTGYLEQDDIETNLPLAKLFRLAGNDMFSVKFSQVSTVNLPQGLVGSVKDKRKESNSTRKILRVVFLRNLSKLA